jgi:hypothetical protein
MAETAWLIKRRLSIFKVIAYTVCHWLLHGGFSCWMPQTGWRELTNLAFDDPSSLLLDGFHIYANGNFYGNSGYLLNGRKKDN